MKNKVSREALSGIKVADFGQFGVGPWTCKHMADHGAEVVHVESNTHVDALRSAPPFKGSPGINRSLYFAQYNNNKYGVTLNLRHPKGVEVAKRIIKWADVVVENHRAGMMDELGLGYEALRKLKPEIIMLSSCSQGQTGPYATRQALGTQITALGGFLYVTGWPDRYPSPPYAAYTDTVVPQFNVVAILAALSFRDKTGEGMFIDSSQVEVGINFLAPLALDYMANGRIAERDGNRSPSAAPHGVYRCLGEDRWCTISVSQADWPRFRKAIGDPAWTKSATFSTFLSRKENEDELNKLVEGWTSRLAPEEVMRRMQAAGVAAGIVQNCQDLSRDPQLQYRKLATELEHPEIGKHNYYRAAFTLSETPAEINRPGCCIGEHNDYFYTQVLGISESEFVQLLNEGVFD
ncbi:MAG: CoA transferase [Chloroflexi bacterium]|nr:CoA transferase [Chloroflexota bacterium]